MTDVQTHVRFIRVASVALVAIVGCSTSSHTVSHGTTSVTTASASPPEPSSTSTTASEESPLPGAAGEWATRHNTGVNGTLVSTLSAASTVAGFAVPEFADLGTPSAIEVGSAPGVVQIYWINSPLGGILVSIGDPTSSSADPSIYADPEKYVRMLIDYYKSHPEIGVSAAVGHLPRHGLAVGIYTSAKRTTIEARMANHFSLNIYADPGADTTPLLMLADSIVDVLPAE